MLLDFRLCILSSLFIMGSQCLVIGLGFAVLNGCRHVHGVRVRLAQPASNPSVKDTVNKALIMLFIITSLINKSDNVVFQFATGKNLAMFA